MSCEEQTDYEKPEVQLTGTDGNVFALMGKCSQALKKIGRADKATEMCEKIKKCGSYDEALQIMMCYVDAL